jgi:hypothetical protein
MLVDASLILSSSQAVTTSAVSINTLDLSGGSGTVPSPQARDIGAGRQLYVHISVDETVTAAGAATVTFQLIGSANADLSSPIVLIQSDAIPKATLVAGYRFALPIPPQLGSIGQRYFGVNYSVATGPLTAGKFTAFVTPDIQDAKVYASGFSVQ